MIVEDAIKAEGCLEGSNVYDLKLVQIISKEFVDYLGKLGKLIYKENYEKPFFRVIVRGKYTIKGVETDNEIRMILPDSGTFSDVANLIEYIKKYQK